MSGGRWGYQAWKMQDHADETIRFVTMFAKAVGETEHIVDWAESGDTSRENAEHELYDLWVRTFDEVFG